MKHLNTAVALSIKSLEGGAFPAGALVVCKDKLISKSTATKFPKINLHPESKAIDAAMEKQNSQLSNCVLYSSMQPCLMCLSRAYWAGIRKITFAIRKEKVPHSICYESDLDHFELLKNFNEKIEMLHVPKMESEALEIVNNWLKEQ